MIKKILFCSTLLLATTSFANPIPKPSLATIAPPPLNINAKAWVLISDGSGQVIAGHEMNERRPVASLSKLMTSYVTSQAIESGKINLNDPVKISVKAWRTGGSKSFIKEGDTVSVENLLKGMIVQSGNDAAVALAEHVAGSEGAFTMLMNHTARGLGMENSHFANASGLPAKDQYSSALDMAKLSRALINHFPKEYAWYKLKSFTVNGIKQTNRNRLLWSNLPVDGLKTGYTDAAGFCLAASANEPSGRYIAVVLGAPSENARAAEAKTLLTYANRFYTTKKLFAKGEAIKQITIDGAADQPLIATVKQPLYITVPKSEYIGVNAKLALKKGLSTPIKAGEQVGDIIVTYQDKTLESRPAYAKSAVENAGIWRRTTHWIKSLFS